MKYEACQSANVKYDRRSCKQTSLQSVARQWSVEQSVDHTWRKNDRVAGESVLHGGQRGEERRRAVRMAVRGCSVERACEHVMCSFIVFAER